MGRRCCAVALTCASGSIDRGVRQVAKVSVQMSNTIHDLVSPQKEKIFPSEYFGELIPLLEKSIDEGKFVPKLRSHRYEEQIEGKQAWSARREDHFSIVRNKLKAVLAMKETGKTGRGQADPESSQEATPGQGPTKVEALHLPPGGGLPATLARVAPFAQ